MDGDTNALSIILISASMISLVIAVMGIKLRWFRHRLTFDQPESQIDSPVLLRTTSTTEVRHNCARGVYRQSVDAEAFIGVEKPSIVNGNDKVKAKNSKFLSHHSSNEPN